MHKNVKLLDEDTRELLILGFLKFRLPPNVAPLWHIEDVEVDKIVGARFTGVNDAGMAEVFIQIGDATNDDTEPDISEITRERVSEIDAHLEKEISKGLAAQGVSQFEWLSSSLNQPEKFPWASYLVSAYRFSAGGEEQIELACRASINGRKVVIVGVTASENRSAVAAIGATLGITIIENQAA